jgi:hypothetical protein
MDIQTINEGIAALLKLGFKTPVINQYCATVYKKEGGSHTIVSIEDKKQTDRIFYEDAVLDIDHKGKITFNGLSFECWKEQSETC